MWTFADLGKSAVRTTRRLSSLTLLRSKVTSRMAPVGTIVSSMNVEPSDVSKPIPIAPSLTSTPTVTRIGSFDVGIGNETA